MTARARVAWAAWIAAAGLAAAAARPAPARAQASPPAPAPARPLALPRPQEFTLPNGLRVALVERRRTPLVAFRLAVPAGRAYAPPGREGIADLAALLLVRGAAGRPADSVAARLEASGATLAGSVGPDYVGVSGAALAPQLGVALRLAGEAAARADFVPAEIERARAQLLAALDGERVRPGLVAARVLAGALYGAHPYARGATPASLRAVTRADLVAFQRARLRPRGALLVVAGDVSLARLRALAEEAFATWTGAPEPPPPAPAPPARRSREILLVDQPGAPGASVAVGNLAASADDPAWPFAEVANRVLGGGTDARLHEVLRERRGWAAGALSVLARPRGTGAFTATAEVRADVADSAVAELLAQLARAGAEPVPAPELAAARAAVGGAFVLGTETVQQVADQVAQTLLLALPPDYLREYPMRVAGATAAAVQAAARRFVRPAEAVVVVVGDAARLRAGLARVAPVRLVDAGGTAVAERAPSAPPAALPLDVRRLVARRDSFALLAGGRPVGSLVLTAARAEGGWTLGAESVLLGAGVRQQTTLLVDGALAPRRLEQRGSVQGRPIRGDVAFAGGRARGTAAVPGPAGMRSVAVDADVPVGTLEQSALGVAVPLLPWAAGAEFVAGVFEPGRNAVVRLTLTAGAAGRVTVPAGTFDAFPVEQRGGEQPLVYHVTTGGRGPARVVRIAFPGQPVEAVLVR